MNLKVYLFGFYSSSWRLSWEGGLMLESIKTIVSLNSIPLLFLLPFLLLPLACSAVVDPCQREETHVLEEDQQHTGHLRTNSTQDIQTSSMQGIWPLPGLPQWRPPSPDTSWRTSRIQGIWENGNLRSIDTQAWRIEKIQSETARSANTRDN